MWYLVTGLLKQTEISSRSWFTLAMNLTVVASSTGISTVSCMTLLALQVVLLANTFINKHCITLLT